MSATEESQQKGRQTFLSDGRPRPRPKKRSRIPERYQQLVDGTITIDDLDDEEITRGMLRNRNGTFSGSPPAVIPWVMHSALKDAMARRTERQLIAKMPALTDALIGIATNKFASADARVKAIGMAMDRALGKVVDKQEIAHTVTAKWEEAAASGRLFVDLDPEHGEEPVFDVDFTDVEPDPDPEQPAIEVSVTPTPGARRPRPRSGVTL